MKTKLIILKYSFFDRSEENESELSSLQALHAKIDQRSSGFCLNFENTLANLTN